MTSVEAMANHFNVPLRDRRSTGSSAASSSSASIVRVVNWYRFIIDEDHFQVQRITRRYRGRPGQN